MGKSKDLATGEIRIRLKPLHDVKLSGDIYDRYCLTTGTASLIVLMLRKLLQMHNDEPGVL